MAGVWRAKRWIRVARRHGDPSGELRLQAVRTLAAQRGNRRARYAPLVQDTLLEAAAAAPRPALKLLAELLPGARDLLPPAYVAQVLHSSARHWGTASIGRRGWFRLVHVLARTGVPLERHLHDLLRDSELTPTSEFPRALTDWLVRLAADDPWPPKMDLLVAAGPLDASGWWCEIGDRIRDAGHGEAWGDLDRAARCYHRARNGRPRESAERTAYLALCRAERHLLLGTPSSRRGVQRALHRFRELHPAPASGLRLLMAAFEIAAGLPCDLEGLRGLGVDWPALRDFWVAVGELRLGHPEEALVALRNCLETVDETAADDTAAWCWGSLGPSDLRSAARERSEALASGEVPRRRGDLESLRAVLPRVAPFAPPSLLPPSTRHGG